MLHHHELAFIGLGRMGLAMSTHLVEQGYDVHGYDVTKDARLAAQEAGVKVHDTIADAINSLRDEKTVWLMVPAKYVNEVLKDVEPLLNAHDTVIDGGNSFFKDTIDRHHQLAEKQIDYLDCGTSGGVEGARFGASLMVGGFEEPVKRHEALFQALAIEDGYGHVGGPGAGHFVKMVHNGIEYGMMGAIAEGMNVLHEHEEGLSVDVCEALKPYQHGSIISSSLMTWLSNTYHQKGYLEAIAGEVPRGETEMEMEYLIQHENVRVLDAALQQRKQTRVEPNYIGTLISAMRNEFGGHKTIPREKGGENETN